MKPTTTMETVTNAVSQLEKEGQKVTVRAVQIKQGGGSLGKIAKLMKLAKEGQVQNTAEIPSSSDKFSVMLKSISEVISEFIAEKDKNTDEEKSLLVEELRDAQAIMKESEEIVAEIEAKLGEKEKVINTLNAKVEVLKEELAKSQELRESLTREASYYRGKYEAAQEGRALVGNVGESKPEEEASGGKKGEGSLKTPPTPKRQAKQPKAN